MTFREAGLKRAAMGRAAQSVLVSDRSKFGRVRPARFAALSDFSAVATEEGLIEPAAVRETATSGAG
jgi:DeoR family deoxyribose operon repressor